MKHFVDLRKPDEIRWTRFETSFFYKIKTKRKVKNIDDYKTTKYTLFYYN